MPTKHQCWLMLVLKIVLWIDYYHPHFTDEKVRHFNHTANFPYACMTQLHAILLNPHQSSDVSTFLTLTVLRSKLGLNRI